MKIRTFSLKNVILLDTVFSGFLHEFTSLESLELTNFQIIHTQNTVKSRVICNFLKHINFEFSSWEVSHKEIKKIRKLS